MWWRFEFERTTYVGTAPPGYQENEWVTHTVHSHGFASLSTEQDESVDNHPNFCFLGNPWRLEICPGGDACAAEGMMSIDCHNRSNKSIDIDFSFSVNDGNGKQVAYKQSDGPINFPPTGGETISKGWKNLAERSILLSSLVDGYYRALWSKEP